MKSFRKIVSEVAQPKAGDEKHFKDKHIVTKVDYPVDVEDQFTGGKIAKAPKRKADHEAGEDEKVYEAIDPVNKKAALGKFKHRADKDIDNDGDVDSSDKYLHARRNAVTKAIHKEEVEELDELSKATLASYARKANNQGHTARSMAKKSDGSGYDKDMARKANNRQDGVARAISRLANEEVEQLDELSPNTLHSYIKKAAGNMAGNAAVAAAQASSSMKKSSPDVKRKIKNRMQGITGASGRLADKANMSENAWEEVPMMMRQLQFIAYASEEIMDYLNESVDPEEWFQNKLAHVHDQMQTLHAYAEGDRRMMSKMDRRMYGEYSEEAELDEAAPKIKPDFLKTQREKDRAHDAAMGRTPTGRKKAMTSTQRSMASMRKEEAELDDMQIDEIFGSSKFAKGLRKKMGDASNKKMSDLYRKGHKENHDKHLSAAMSGGRTSDHNGHEGAYVQHRNAAEEHKGTPAGKHHAAAAASHDAAADHLDKYKKSGDVKHLNTAVKHSEAAVEHSKKADKAGGTNTDSHLVHSSTKSVMSHHKGMNEEFANMSMREKLQLQKESILEREMTSTQRSMAAMRKEETDLDEATPTKKAITRALQGMKVQPKEKVTVKKAPWEKNEEVDLDESITKMSHGRLKFHLNTNTPHGSYSNDEMKSERDRRLKSGAGEAYRKAKAGLSESVEMLDEAFKAGMVKLKDGGSVVLKKEDADLLNKMFKDLSTANRKKMQEVAMKDKSGFEEILGFAREAI